jgi:imidazole glycerol-phosphate synthase subunit HisH
MRVVVVRTHTANTASVLAGLVRAGASVCTTEDPELIASADRVVLPGVGAFGAAMTALVGCGADQALRHRVEQQKPTLAICLGLQLLCRSSEESPGVCGLGILDEEVGHFSDTVRVPQMGWNRVEPEPGAGLLMGGHAYFANSYRLTSVPQGWRAAWSEHGEPFIAAVERGPVLACQFHPELSGAWGGSLLRRWLCSPCV